MNHWKAAALTTVAALGAGPAFAADIPQIIDVPQIIEAPQPVAVGGGWYLRGDVGVSVRNKAEFHNRTLSNLNPARTVKNGMFVDTQLDEGLSVGVGAGYRFNKFFRADVTAEFRGSIGFAATDKYDYTFTYCGGGATNPNGSCVTPVTETKTRNNFYRGSLNSQVYLANAYADVGTFGRLSPFVGVGIGAAHHSISGVHDWDPSAFNGGAYTMGKSSNWDLAYAVHAGLGFKASKNLTVEAGYRYLNLGDAVGGEFTELKDCPCDPTKTFDGHELKDLDSHEVRLGMRWEFGAEDHYVEPLPVHHYPDIPYKN